MDMMSDPNIDVGMLSQMRLDLEAAHQALSMFDEPPPEALEQIAEMEAMIAEVEQEQRRRLDALAGYLGQEFDRCIKARANIDQRMWADERQYEGRSRYADPNKRYPTDNNPPDDDGDSTIHETRSFTNLFAARVVDMVLPTNEVPFRVDPDEHPDPSCIPTFVPPQPTQGGVDPETGEPLPPVEPTPEDVELAIEDANERAAGKMQNTIKDQLFEGGLQRHGRKSIKDAFRIGVGIVRGPYMQYKRRNKVRFGDGAADPVVEVDTLTVPGLAYVNPAMFWYDMTPCLSKARKTFECELYDRSEMMELKKYPNVIIGAVDELLEEKEPSVGGTLGETLRSRNLALKLIEPLDGRWAVIRVHAAIDARKLQEIGGIEWPHADVMPLIEMLMCNGKCLKWKLAELECGYRVPYYAFTPFPCDDTIYGWSVPYLARSAQAGVDGAWTATKLNAAVSAGPHLFLQKGSFEPKDGAWRQLGPKTYDFLGDGTTRIQDCMASVLMTSNVKENLELLEVARDNMSRDTMLSQILQGNVTEANQGPAAGLVQLINLNTIVQREIATAFDDGIAQPLAEAFGQWNLLYNPDQSIKGDFNYRATASTAFIAKDVQTQHLQILTQMAADERFAGYSDNYALWMANVKILDVPDKDQILKPRDKALADQAAMQQAQPDPLLQAKMAEIELGKQKLEAETQIRMAELQLEQQKLAIDTKARADELAIKLQIEQEMTKRAFIELQAKQQMDIAKLDAEVDAAVSNDATTRMLEGAKISQKASKDQAEIELKAAKVAQDANRIQLAQNPSPDSALD